ncbi:hypothetical protein AMJ40_07180 [candidate division TA06 bacterium DG_26]|uniref:Xylose isomerase-like TIM barrel domain-containing protein n=1 Tax=candidate division TA06 bacterium DG_26 TaxID=1703771 RepID=A0A0S7WEU0_UNCT6|nr:MAG: hypothetical protein AMJ40_07180 [candidate division TA06 bacterium DG_26]
MAEILHVGISTCFNYDIPFARMVRLIRENRFDALSLGGERVSHSGYDTGEGRRLIRTILREQDLILDSIHAPIGEQTDISSEDDEVRATGCAGIRSAVDACSELESTVVVVHLNSRFDDKQYESRHSRVIRSLDELIPYADCRGVKLAVENLPRPVSMRLFDTILKRYPELRVCYDSSHAFLNGTYFSGTSVGILKKYYDRVTTIHLSDGTRNVDDHLLPYEGKIDWNDFAGHFSRTTYRGTLLLEVEMKATAYTDPAVFLSEAYERAAKLRSLFEKKVGQS